jgi:ABC-type transport system involved in cytochrome bd biosynthesis fused ATPase/permease subunit
MGNRYTDETMKVLRVSFLSALVLELAATISVALIAVSIGIRLVNGSMEFFPALAVLVLAPEVYFPLRNAASLFHASADGSAALSEINDLSSNVVEITDGVEVISEIKSLKWQPWSSPFGAGKIAGESLNPREILVIRGGSGVGKTTFLNSLLGLNRSSTSEINGHPVHAISRASLFRQVGWIPQNPSLITGTIRELFTLVKPGLSLREIEELLHRVGLKLSSFPDGVETIIGGLGEKSGKVSGGQKRRLAIARAILVNPSLIIADEPTADLDPQSAKEILTLLHATAQAGAIVIVVLHAPDQEIAGAREIKMVER